MESASAKEKVLKTIREALIAKDEELLPEKYELKIDREKTKIDFPDLVFAEKFQKNGGEFILCQNGKELVEKITHFFHDKKLSSIFCNNSDLGEVLKACNVSSFDKTLISSPYDYFVMPVDAMVAETGAIVISTSSTNLENIQNHFNHIVLIALSTQAKRTEKEALSTILKNNTNSYPAQTIILRNTHFNKNLKITLFLRYVA
ncbi:MAG: hypothetical protein ACOXZK_07125 [Bacteroidales bacterium]|jgi:hypothetical protein|nr:hypothetical protein [Bacteroidales bacterium]